MDKRVRLPQDSNYESVPAPTITRVEKTGASITPTVDMLVTLGADVTLTIDGVSIDLLKAFTFGMMKDVTYEFSVDISIGIA